MKKTWSDDDIEFVAKRIKAIANPMRLGIICSLADGELYVQQIGDLLDTSQPNVSQHLLVLHNKGLIRSTKKANRVFYSIADPELLKLIEAIRSIYCSQ